MPAKKAAPKPEKKAAPKPLAKTAKKAPLKTQEQAPLKPVVAPKPKTTKEMPATYHNLKWLVFILFLFLGSSVAYNLKFFLGEKVSQGIATSVKETFQSEEDNVKAGGFLWKKVGPLTDFTIVIDSGCAICTDISQSEEALLKIFPFAEIKVMDLAKDKVGEKVSAVPTILINKGIEKFNDFAELSRYLKENPTGYEINPAVLGLISNKVIIDKSMLPALEKGDQLTIIQYFEAGDPATKKFFEETEGKIKEKYGEQVKFDLRHFSIRKDAVQAAIAMECAKITKGEEAEQELYEIFFRDAGKRDFSEETINSYAQEAGLGGEDFAACLKDEGMVKIAQDQQDEAIRVGINNSPSFLIGDKLIVGAQPLTIFEQVIDAELAKTDE